ncbi:MAG: PIG-L family deacetylase [Chloroflexi bacterium]|nr:PIG-L family deacetylase [Chloroflexota bacterium]
MMYGKTVTMDWCYLSPHLDDAILSCGGLIWEQIQTGERVEIWTICAGDPPSLPFTPFAQELHHRWRVGAEAVQSRREEDRKACQILGASWRHFAIPDCIYRTLPDSRQPVIGRESDLFAEVSRGENSLIEMLAETLAHELPAGVRLVSPLTLGGHIDHRLTRQAAENEAVRCRVKNLGYYADYPYAVQKVNKIAEVVPQGWERVVYPVSHAGLENWQAAISTYASQISTFWPDLSKMREELRKYWGRETGISLWFSPLSI